MSVIPFLEGHLVYLRGLTADDARETMWQWSNNRQVTRYLFRGAYPVTPSAAVAQLEASERSSNEVELGIVTRDGERLIGLTGLHSIQLVPRTAEFRILIGEPEYWGGGYGTEVTQLMVVYGFEVLNLNRIWLGVTADNAGAVRAYEKSGFQREGLLRQEVYRNSRYYDVVRMSILRSEYDQVSPQWSIADRIKAQFPA